jgi:hypothetical protein
LILSCVLYGESDIIEAVVEQAIATIFFHFKADDKSVIGADSTFQQINNQSISWSFAHPLEEFLNLCLFQADRQHPVLEAVVIKDIRKGRSNNAAKAVIL